MVIKFRRAGSEGSLNKDEGPTAEKSDSKKHVRTRSLTDMLDISGLKQGNTSVSQNRFIPLADLDMEERNDMELEQSGEDVMGGFSMQVNGASAVEQSKMTEVNQ